MSGKDKAIYTFVREPRDESYRLLLDYSLKPCATALLVTQGEVIPQSAKITLDLLGPHLIDVSRSMEWPGTRLCGEGPGATVRKYNLTSDMVAVLKAVARGLYSWRYPQLPEDLCLLRSDGTPWLVTITHEEDAYFELTAAEVKDLSADLPEIGALLRADAG